MKAISPVLLLAIISCSILEEGDITSFSQLDNPILQSFSIIQNTKLGDSEIQAIKLSDSTYSTTDAKTGARIVRTQKFNLPPLGKRLKLRSGVSTEVVMTVTYTEHNKPYTVALFKGDSLVEVYRFRYSNYTASGKLNRIVTIIDPIGSAATIHSNDTIIFASTPLLDGSPKITSIVRRSVFANQSGTFGVTFSSDGLRMNGFSYGGTCYATGDNQNNISYCGQGGYGVGISYSNQVTSLGKYVSLNSSCCSYDLSHFYFHPLFLFSDKFDSGGQLLLIYTKDWWVGTYNGSSQQSNMNESVLFIKH